jgi:GNAT superfamily N-acetyltransferase
MSIAIVQARPDSPDAAQLIAELETAIDALSYPPTSRHGFSVPKLLREGVAFFVTHYDGLPAGCGGIKLFGTDYGEVKRMYVRPLYRGLRLETGIYQTEAIRLYERFGFQRRLPFGEYQEDPLSVYFEKRIA